MPSSRILIASNTLTGTAASVTFSSIPSTYTDLVLRISARNDATAVQNRYNITLNNNSNTIYSLTLLRGDGASAISDRLTSQTAASGSNSISAASGTANTFSNNEVYFPNYTASANKPFSSFDVQENNTTTAYIHARAHLFSSTSAITEIKLDANTFNFVSGSSFFLYGLKNS